MSARSTPAAIAVLLLAACSGDGHDNDNDNKTSYQAEIRRTSWGIPHVVADDEASLGFGIAYAYAQDNVCSIAEKFMSLRGERSRHFGPGKQDAQAPLPENIASDYAQRLIQHDGAVQAYWQAQTPEVRALHTGWVAGYNRFLKDSGPGGLPAACRNAAWVREIDHTDLVRLMRYYATLNGLSGQPAALAAAQPPGAEPAVAEAKAAARREPRLAQALPRRPRTASNGVAFGRAASENGRGLLLGNPHFPWSGIERMYQLHLTLPGRMDVMGATLPGLPAVGIGFTRDFAWTHTTSNAARSTFYRLELDPADATRYRVDGISKPMVRRHVEIEVLGADGRLVRQARDFYATEFGPVVVVAGTMDWSATAAYAMRDMNVDNHRMVAQWHAMNRARSLAELKAANLRIVGNPWNTTLAADKDGRTLFMDVTPVPNLPARKLADCQVPEFESLVPAGIWVLDGRTAACHWDQDPRAPQPGVLPADQLPVLERDDYVHNANDSAWLTQPAAPLVGPTPVANLVGQPPSLRTRSGLTQIEDRLAGRDGQPGRRISLRQVQDLVMNNRVHLAELVLDDLLQLCRPGQPLATEAGSPCPALAAWHRRAELDAGIGYGYFEALQPYLQDHPEVWRLPYDPQDPLHTPRGLKVDDAAVASALQAALREAVAQTHAAGWTPGRTWGEVQGATRGGVRVPVHGGSELLGIYNAMYAEASAPGEREVLEGASYLQAVGFDADGPHAQALLAYSQSDNPDSPHFKDQTERFSRKDWIVLPFTEEQIRSDPGYRRLVLKQ
ncbi:penicillin acylase family protein [Eleftheria terrae]|uniref:penicillin acylase family protein n=1 Tax=Eleftheria terrae TaxID=1597781 RepID=UPI00263B8E4A|nr:penicillin acylase family protein [Eleftheria terrae]WKB53590.1 penicillin acylase family protein [Eleftheria terrae]